MGDGVCQVRPIAKAMNSWGRNCINPEALSSVGFSEDGPERHVEHLELHIAEGP